MVHISAPLLPKRPLLHVLRQEGSLSVTSGMMELLAAPSKLLRTMETDKSDFPEKQEYKHVGKLL